MKYLKNLSVVLSLLMVSVFICASVYADTWVNGYTKKNGTFVQGHYRSSPDNNPYNNWSTKGNVNPYTGRIGTRNVNPYTGSTGMKKYDSFGDPYNSNYGRAESNKGAAS